MSVARIIALVVGWFYTIVGIIGFLALGLGSGVFVGFALDPIHNLIHLATGLVGLYFGYAMAGRLSRPFNQVVGIIYAILTVVGFIVAGVGTGVLLTVSFNLADNILHLITALVALYGGYMTARAAMPSSETTRRAA